MVILTFIMQFQKFMKEQFSLKNMLIYLILQSIKKNMLQNSLIKIIIRYSRKKKMKKIINLIFFTFLIIIQGFAFLFFKQIIKFN